MLFFGEKRASVPRIGESLSQDPARLLYSGSSGNRVGDFGTSERWKHACEDLEPQIFLVAQAVGAPLDDADLVVEALNEAERDFVFRLAVGGDTVPMPINHRGELLKRFEPLPLQA